MTKEQLEKFHLEKHLIHLATLSPNGYPHVVPIWYIWDGTSFWMSTPRTTKKIRNLEANPKAGFSIGPESLPYSSITGHGDVELSVDDGKLVHRLCERYLPQDKVEPYYSTLIERGARTAIKLTPTKFKTRQG